MESNRAHRTCASAAGWHTANSQQLEDERKLETAHHEPDLMTEKLTDDMTKTFARSGRSSARVSRRGKASTSAERQLFPTWMRCTVPERLINSLSGLDDSDV
jgi:hypothetical protein